MLAVRLTDEMERRLEALAERTGRTKTFYAREAIEAHLSDLEEFYLTAERLRRFSDRDLDGQDGDASAKEAAADILEALRSLWTQGEESGAPIEGNFDPVDIAGRGAARLAAARLDD